MISFSSKYTSFLACVAPRRATGVACHHCSTLQRGRSSQQYLSYCTSHSPNQGMGDSRTLPLQQEQGQHSFVIYQAAEPVMTCTTTNNPTGEAPTPKGPVFTKGQASLRARDPAVLLLIWPCCIDGMQQCRALRVAHKGMRSTVRHKPASMF